ncbi:hypothetical protein NDU88_006954 [Pleurodeles waltl]|uniref:Uncharacterized protein n=1 Tax=Pleurodeles waltl TaxID=8319 RepID=A0AAV7QN89_PLEWA|nr:hypothetical protein NDU88_006954 [Pleurodeles waltl]
MKDDRSKDFYDLDALRLFLDGLEEHDMKFAPADSETASSLSIGPPTVAALRGHWYPNSARKRGRDMERLARSQSDRDKALKEVEAITN